MNVSKPCTRVCDYCGLPLAESRSPSQAPAGQTRRQYCCFGCRFAAAIAEEPGEEGEAKWMLTRLVAAVCQAAMARSQIQRTVDVVTSWFLIELPLIFATGILGTAHCLGMCGPFSLVVSGGTRSSAGKLARQFAYTLGRTFSYCVLGAAAGFGGLRLTQLVPWLIPWLIDAGALLAIVGGMWLFIQGLRAAGVWKQFSRAPSGPCLAGDLFRSMLRLPGISGVFVAGLYVSPVAVSPRGGEVPVLPLIARSAVVLTAQRLSSDAKS